MITPISIDFSSLNISTLFPMLVAIVGGLFMIVIDLISKKQLHKSFYVMLTILFLIIDLGAVAGFSGTIKGFFDVMLMDGVSVLSQIIILVASILFILLALSHGRFHEYRYPEYFALFLFMVAGFQFMVSRDSLILIFVGLETASMALYTLIAMHNRSNSYEAAVKYFTMGALAAGFFVMGSAMVYAATGSLELYKIASLNLISTLFSSISVIPSIRLGFSI